MADANAALEAAALQNAKEKCIVSENKTPEAFREPPMNDGENINTKNLETSQVENNPDYDSDGDEIVEVKCF